MFSNRREKRKFSRYSVGFKQVVSYEIATLAVQHDSTKVNRRIYKIISETCERLYSLCKFEVCSQTPDESLFELVPLSALWTEFIFLLLEGDL